MATCAPRSVAQTTARSDLYACEGCEHALEADPATLSWASRIAPEEEPGEALVVNGTIYRTDGVTPAADVIVYAHHTDATGVYPGGGPEIPGSARDGRLRGWVKTGADGRYRFETIKPAPYPAMTMPAHVHLYIAERDRRPYYIDDIVFDGEFGVDAQYRAAQELRGGSGIVTLERDTDRRLIARRDIVLERHP